MWWVAHFWLMDEHRSSVDTHVVVDSGAWTDADQIKQAIKQTLREAHGIEHSTIEMECAKHACGDAPLYGH